MYIELDQWPVQPHAKLEPTFKKAGLLDPDSNKKMGIVTEYPCDNIREGGHFNMGNYIFVRDKEVIAMFDDWYHSQVHNQHSIKKFPYNKYPKLVETKPKKRGPQWPARQGAFSQDSHVYQKYQSIFYQFDNGNPFGSPFGTLVGHFTGGYLEETYDPGLARANFHSLINCVKRRLNNKTDTLPCSAYPKWVGGTCMMCRGSVNPNGNVLGFFTGKGEDYHYTGCCGRVDSAIPLETFVSEVKRGLHRPGKKIDLVTLKALDALDYPHGDSSA
jgi:hypothetical protein